MTRRPAAAKAALPRTAGLAAAKTHGNHAEVSGAAQQHASEASDGSVAADAVLLAHPRPGVAQVTLSHPGRMNAITVRMWRQFAEIITGLARDDSVHVIVLEGAQGHFAAGADIREFPRERADHAGVMRYHQDTLAPALHALRACPQPLVASIAGVCVGGGLEIASCCDLRIAAASARFGAPINRLGFPMAPEEMRGLLALAGRAGALEILLEGRVFGAEEAYAKGLLTRIVPDAQLAEQTQQAVERILAGSPLAARLNKRMAARLSAPVPPLTQDELSQFYQYADSHDHKEGVQSFLHGATPVFTGA